MIVETIHVEEQIETGESAVPWDSLSTKALTAKGILDSESNSRDEQSHTASPELIKLLFYCWMMHKKEEPLRLFLQKLLAQEEEEGKQ